MRTIQSAVFAVLLMVVFSNANAVTYEVTFTGTWNADDSESFPLFGSEHFTDLIGTTHSAGNAFWVTGGIASPGVESVAETGGTFTLEQELAAARRAGASGATVNIGPVNVIPDSVSKNIEVELNQPYITLISMIAPSPDWFVGVSGLSLRVNGRWLEDLTIALRPYDAGTEEGNSFSLGNPATEPQEPIFALSGSPFIGRPSIGTLRLVLRSPQPPSSDNNSGAATLLPAIISTILE